MEKGTVLPRYSNPEPVPMTTLSWVYPYPCHALWMDVYPDDIAIYDDSLDKHIEHVQFVVDKEKFYLSQWKLQFLCGEMKILGHIIDNGRIWMDPAKVDGMLAWKVPTNWDLLQGFLGSVGYLVDDLAQV